MAYWIKFQNIYIILHIKRHYFIHFCNLFLKSLIAFSVSLTTESFPARLKLPKLANKHGIAEFVKETDFQEKLMNINKKNFSNKTRQVEVEKELDDLKKAVRLISTKGLKKGLIEKFSIVNGAKHFGENRSQNYLLFQRISN